MKVCIFSRSAYPLFNPACNATFGGAEVDMFLLALELAKDQKYEVTCVVGDFGQKDIETYDGVIVVKSYDFSLPKIRQMIILLRTLFSIKADIYIQESASGGTGLIALLARLMGKHFIYRTASDIDTNGEFIFKNKIEGLLYRLGLWLATVVISQNDAHAFDLKKRYRISSPVIKNAVKIELLSQVERRHVLWVGRSEKLKQPGLFLDMAKRFPHENFVIICPKANADSVNNAELSFISSTLPNVTYVERVPFNMIDPYFKAAQAFVNTSTYEGFPNTFVQALKYGVPVFSLNVNPDNFISKYDCGFAAEGNFENLCTSLEYALRTPERMTELEIHAYSYAKEHHDMSVIIEKYKKILEAVSVQ